MERVKMITLLALVVALGVGIGLGWAKTNQASTETVDVRIAVQRHANGDVEFGLQNRESDDDWGEIQLPHSRFLTTEAPTGRWLYSTSVGVSFAVSANPTAVAADFTAPNVDSIPSQESSSWTGVPIEASASQHGAATYGARRDRHTGEIVSFVGTSGTGGDSLYQGQLLLGCSGKTLGLVIGDLPFISSSTTSISVSIVIDDRPALIRTVSVYRSAGGDRNVRFNNPHEMMDLLHGASRLYVRLQAHSRRFDGEFDLTGFLTTPIQPNIDHCGEY